MIIVPIPELLHVLKEVYKLFLLKDISLVKWINYLFILLDVLAILKVLILVDKNHQNNDNIQTQFFWF